jgi:methionine-rich copper-binding protein CopC
MLAVAVLLAGTAAVAEAHAEYDSSNPAAGAVVAALPGQVTITFTEGVARGTGITVTGPTGATVSANIVTLTGKQATVDLSGGGPGVYTVNWKSVSADDGDEDSGSFQFGVGQPGTVQPAPAPVAPRTGTGVAAVSTGAWPVAAGAVALMLLGVVVIRRRTVGGGHSGR